MVAKYLFIYTVGTYVLCSYFPWWTLAIIATLIGFCSSSLKSGVFYSVIPVTLAWSIKLIENFFVQDHIILNKIKIFMNLNSFQLILLTLMIPIIVGCISSVFGYKLKEVIKSEE
ncbi:MAG: hypothetical protein CMG00_08835 [Candidatus Marinimicrobia bacterium]|nr:hypothetical protein [Candidatus Neomarinimicrobiota bacterium]|tara:strand:- start:1272 stop:1616 length:345 start_codon:yes stop_codon:yes gene_type:complete